MSSIRNADYRDEEHQVKVPDHPSEDPNQEFGGTEARNEMEKKLLRRLDLRMSILLVIFILNFVLMFNQSGSSAARLRGFESDLHLVGQQFNTVLSILYVGYILMQIPSNMFLNYIGRPSLYLPTAMCIWGAISILTGDIALFVGVLLARFFLGFVEAAFIPGSLFLLSKWYKRSELGQRTALLSCGSLISNAFGALVASGILDGMEGKLGRAAWRWLFFIEGALTIFVAICALFILPDFPSTPCRWLTPLERRLAERRIDEDFVGIYDGSETEHGNKAGFISAVTDWKVWWLALALMSMEVCQSFAIFFPTLSATMGYNRTDTLLLCAPPWIFATVVAFAVTRHSDKTGERFWHIAIPLLFGFVGFVIAASTLNTGARYLSLFLMAQSLAALITFLAWISSSIPLPASKRAVALALINGFSQLGSVAGSYVWPTAWGPTYRYSCAICIAAGGVTILMCYAFRQHLAALNEKAKKDAEGRGGEPYLYLL
ncbi:MFS general substrate transporter [Athelia psychrophila]|uniref:MFS general substrate transporter n=1 Tax=Athelia psychrophila TaxID=1759441 RepID=A0A166VNC9_9AGAM|nr:MFS general substrate transporter [Fibularhizoctonia sp. CBS 109695]